jgi:hypothetical protein
VFSAGVPTPWGLAAGAGGRVLVSGASGIYSLRGAGGPATRIAAVAASPIARAPGGDVYLADGSTLGVVRAGTRTPVTLSRDVSSPHGLLVEPASTLVVSDTGAWPTGSRAPSARSSSPRGSILVVEFDAGLLLRIANRQTMVVTAALRRPYALARTRDGSVYVVEDGDLSNPTGGIARVAADGTVTRLRLVAR